MLAIPDLEQKNSLEQNDVNLALFASGCTTGFQAAPTATPPNVFTNAPFAVDSFIPSSATTCPKPNGTFAAHVPLRLTYRILGPTQIDGADALLLEPLKLEAAR